MQYRTAMNNLYASGACTINLLIQRSGATSNITQNIVNEYQHILTRGAANLSFVVTASVPYFCNVHSVSCPSNVYMTLTVMKTNDNQRYTSTVITQAISPSISTQAFEFLDVNVKNSNSVAINSTTDLVNGYVAYFTYSATDSTVSLSGSIYYVPLTISNSVDTVIVSQLVNTQLAALSATDAGTSYGQATYRVDNNNTRVNIFRLDFGSSATVPTNLCVNNRAANYILYATGLGTDY